jgi:hypothetical protein
MKRILSLSILLILTCYTSVFAWGHKGHSLVAEVAFKYLDAKTKQNVLSYLNGMSIEEASNWMDEMRSDSKYDYMKPYHYVNIRKGFPIKEVEGDNIINALNQTLSELNNIKSMSNDDIKLRLFYLFHLIGDLHQPLHVGYGEDKGGNTVQVSFFGRGSNLHKMWDSEIIEYKALTLEQVLKMNDFEPSEISALKSINVLSWVTDSRSHLKSVYSFNNAKIDDRYVDANYPIVKMQILKAGLRLASILEYYFKDVTYLASNKPDVVTDETEVSVTIDVNKSKDYEGKLVYTCAKVYSTKVIKSNGMILMNVGGEYPNAPLTIVIYSDSLKNFDSAPEEFYKGKNICVGGKVKMYKGKPEIIIKSMDSIIVK